MPPAQQPPAADKPDAAPDEKPVAMVVVQNRTSQQMSISFDKLDGAGAAEVKLPPHGQSYPVPDAHVTPYTHGLAASGHVTIRRAQ